MGKLTPEGRTLASLRTAAGLTRLDLSALLGHRETSKVAHFENGTRVLTPEHLEEIAAATGTSPEGVGLLHLAHRVLLLDPAGEAGGTGPLAPTPEERQAIRRTVQGAAWAVAETLMTTLPTHLRSENAREAKEQAEIGWAWLEPRWREHGEDLVAVNRSLHTPAMAARVCEASVLAAANDVEDALALAHLAVYIAEQVPEEARRLRAVGYCRGFVANALHVGEKLAAAGAELERAWKLWNAGDPSEPEILPEWRLHSLKISHGTLRATPAPAPEWPEL